MKMFGTDNSSKTPVSVHAINFSAMSSISLTVF